FNYKGKLEIFYSSSLKLATQHYKECIAYQNKGKALFADSFILTESPILIQDKQSITSQKRQIIGNNPNVIAKNLLKNEHTKCDIDDHIFILVTDKKQRDNSDEKLKDNEILISYNNVKAVFREILALRKLY
ncbi:2054_t:CDS:1, partial [Funneliformis caledonium]